MNFVASERAVAAPNAPIHVHYQKVTGIDEPGRDLWNINGVAPPPFGSIGEVQWIKENKALPYTEDDKLPLNSSYARRMAGDKTP